MNWLIPWVALSSLAQSKSLIDELRRELNPAHPLYSLPVTPIAFRQDCDDVLFKLLNGSERLVVVHLSYSMRQEANPDYPTTQFFKSPEDFTQECMIPAHERFIGKSGGRR